MSREMYERDMTLEEDVVNQRDIEDDIIEDDTQARVWATKSRSKQFDSHLDEDIIFSNLNPKEMRIINSGVHLLKQVRIFEMDKRTNNPMKGGFGDILEHNLRTRCISSRAKNGETAQALLTKSRVSKHEYEVHQRKKGLLGIGRDE